ncbi:endonuclease [Lacinutrix chionoecetis]
MKHYYLTLIFILTVCIGFAQIPANYYDSANGLSGYTLKTELKNITSNGHTARTYDQLYDGVGVTGSQGYIDTHSDVNVTGGTNYENDGTILDMYSEDPSGADPYNFTHGNMQCGNQSEEGDCYNREHIVPQSSFNSAFPMQSDIHHVIPTDGRVNNFRGSLPFANVATPDFISENGSKRGSSAVSGYSGVVFEPIDEFKGDIARALLYFATRYEDTVDNYTGFDMFNGSNDQVFFPWAITTLLDWHYNVDPVDQREIARNDEAYNFQGNANPFVDHPEYANLIWNPTPDTTPPTNPTNLVASNPTDNSIDLTWTASTDDVAIASYNIYINTAFSFNTNNTSGTAAGLLPDTTYCFTVTAVDTSGNESGFSNQTCETTTDNGSTGGNVDLFFSEYVEGGGTNKALEIANYTGSAVNLSAYTLKLASNNNGFGTAYSFATSSLSDGDVYVVANSGLSVACQPQQDDVNNSITGFSGNDAIGLFKNDVLIDIIGIEADGGTFAQNVTLIRKPTIAFPTTTFDINEWNQLPQDDCSNLGTHLQTLSTSTFEANTFKIYPNPINGTLLNIEVKQNTHFEIYNILGKKMLEGNVTPANKEVSVSRLNKGVYILKLNTQQGSISKKLIKG